MFLRQPSRFCSLLVLYFKQLFCWAFVLVFNTFNRAYVAPARYLLMSFPRTVSVLIDMELPTNSCAFSGPKRSPMSTVSWMSKHLAASLAVKVKSLPSLK